MYFSFDNTILYHAEMSINERINFKLSKELLLIFIDGKNVCSVCPKAFFLVSELVDELEEIIKEYAPQDIEQPRLAELVNVSKWAIENVR